MSDNSISENHNCTRGLSGLINLGNTCYMNSIIQSISSTDLLNYYLRNKKFKLKLKNGINRILLNKLRKNTDLKADEYFEISTKKLNYKYKNSITYRLYQVIIMMWSINCELSPKKLKKSVDTLLPYFKGYSQHDGHEFIIYLLDRIHEENKSDVVIKKLKINKVTSNYIEKKTNLKNLIEYTSNEKDKETYEEELNILYNENYNLDIQYEGVKFYQNFIKDNHSIITELFYGVFISEIQCENCSKRSVSFEPFNVLQLDMKYNIYTLEELLESYFCENIVSYKCEKCKIEGNAKKNLRIHILPEKLIIQYKRFIVRGRYSKKDQSLINFPIDNLLLNEVSTNKNITYELYSIVNHIGSVDGGHYTNYSKNQMNNKWYEFNDSSVYYIKYPDKAIISQNAFIIFYQKKRNKINFI